MEKNKTWYSIRINSRTSVLLLYTYNLSKTINKSKPISFAEDTNILAINSNPTDFKNDIYTVFEHIN
jgi:hypothetical protein